MKSVIAAAAAFAAVALAETTGKAVVVNSCDYPVYLENTPAADGGYTSISDTLQQGDSYSQTWTELSNGDGWSIKLSKTEGSFGSDIMQYEYTWLGWSGEYGGLIWYDLSDVNGNPWDGNWEFTATGDCDPRDAAYMYSTDDAYGEQSCPGSSTITVTLCSGDSSSSSSGSSSSSSVAESSTSEVASSTSEAPSSTSEAPATSTSSTSVATFTSASFQDKAADSKTKHKASSVQTTLATVASSATTTNEGGVTVTEIATEVVTSFVTATAEAVAVAARHEHQHIARHPHHHHL